MGNEFVEIFEDWAESYDQTIAGQELEYQEVFLHYEDILQEVAQRSIGRVLEFGVGTGNLTKKLLNNGLSVTGIEPSQAMRRMANEKLDNQVPILEGDFFRFPSSLPFDTVVSTYVFHHLTDEEKASAINCFSKRLPSGGKLVFADTMYESIQAYHKAISDALQKEFHHLAEDLQREYYTTIPYLKEVLEKNSFEASFKQCNDFVWLMEAVRK